MILLTQSSTPIIGQVAWVLGKIMEGIFTVLDFIGIPNIGLSIILFTIVVYLLMMPLTIKQQKFSKLSAKMNPEIQAIQAKYKGKSDNDSMMAQNQEVQAVYAKYGVSPTGSCVQLIIQMPILFALYQVIQAMPAYVGKIGNTFGVLADKIISVDNGQFLQNSGIDTIANTVTMYGKHITEGNVRNGIIDVLNRLSSTDMAAIAEHYDLASLTYKGDMILSNGSARGLIDTYNNFLGLNMGNSPSHIINGALETGSYLLVVGAILIPVLSALTQWINVKLMPTQENENKNTQENSMASSMKMMNNIMPLMSAWFCFTLPSGMGLYWIAGSVVRTIQQIVINKHIDKMDFDEIIKKNSAKSAKKMEKMKAQQEKLNAYANMNTRNIQTKQPTQTKQPAQAPVQTKPSIQNKANAKSSMTDEEREAAVKKSTDYYNNGNAKPGSLMARANMVKQYNEKNNKDVKKK